MHNVIHREGVDKAKYCKAKLAVGPLLDIKTNDQLYRIGASE